MCERQWRKLTSTAPPLCTTATPAYRRTSAGSAIEAPSAFYFLHLFRCEKTKPLWRACADFCDTVLETNITDKLEHAIIFGKATATTLLPEPVRAFLRHAYNQFYHDFANVDIQGTIFTWQATFLSALRSFKRAILRYVGGIARLYATRMYSTLTEVVPQEARERFPQLVDIGTEGDYALTDAFQSALTDAEAELTAHRTRHVARPRPNQNRAN